MDAIAARPPIPQQGLWIRGISGVHKFLKRKGVGIGADMLATLFTEPLSSMRLGGMIWRDLAVHPVNVNPTSLTDAQRAHPPVFVFPGDNSGQGSFEYLVNALAERHPDVAFFTMNLPGIVSADRHLQIIITRIREVVRTLFGGVSPPCIGLMGHSSGSTIQAAVADALQLPQNRDLPNVGLMIRIGEFFKSEEEAAGFVLSLNGFVCEIGGIDDALEGCTSYLPKQLMVPGVGHTGLLQDPRVVNYADQELCSWLTAVPAALAKVS